MQVQSLQAQLKAKGRDYEEARSLSEQSLQHQQRQLRDENDSLRTARDELQAHLDTALQHKRTLQDEIAELNETLRAAQAQADTQARDVAFVVPIVPSVLPEREQVSALRQQVAQLERQLRDVRQQLELADREHKRQCASLTTQCADLEKQLSERQAAARAAETQRQQALDAALTADQAVRRETLPLFVI
jgi:chromosome segregation ATPase